VLDTCRELEREGFEVTYLGVQANGLIDLEELKAAMRPDTILVSVMFVNNEIGVIQDIPAIGELCRSKGILFHVDAAQATGKVEIDLSRLKVDLMSFSAHKTYGPKGIGALYVRRKPRVRLEAQMHGGGHERGMRSGTLATHQIVGMGEAFRIAKLEMGAENRAHPRLRDKLWRGFQDMEEVHLNGDLERRIAGNLNVSFNFVEGESLIMAIKDLASPPVRPAPRPAWSRPTCSRPWAATTNWRTARSASPSAASPPRKRSTTPSSCCTRRSASCARCRRCGKCSRTASI
jgi:cysteine desulfurase